MYAVTGSSRQLAVGPVALVSLLTATGLATITTYEENPSLYIQLAVTVSLLVGFIQVGMGLLRLGFLVSFMSHAVIGGFTGGAAILIGISQAKHLLGYDVPKSHSIQEYLEGIFSNIGKLHWQTLLFSLLWLGLLIGSKLAGKRWKRLKLLKAMGPLIVTVLGTFLTYVARLDRHAGLKIVGDIPDGLPKASASYALGRSGDLLTTALIISFVGFLESIAIAQAIAKKHGYKVDSNQELIGLGSANLIGSLFQSYPTTGGFSRTAINNEAGAQTPLASILSAFVILLTLLVLTPLFHYLPKSVLGAIVVSAVASLVDLAEAQSLYRVSKFDFAVWLAAFMGVLLLGVEMGVGVAIVVSLLIVIYKVSRPKTAVLGKIPGHRVFRDITQYPQGELHEGVLVFRMDAPLFFANAQYFRDKVDESEDALWCAFNQRAGAGDGKMTLGGVVHFVVLEMAPMATIDATGAHVLHEMAHDYKARGVQLVLANPNRGSLAVLERAGVIDEVGREWVFFRAHEAVAACRAALKGLEAPTAAPSMACAAALAEQAAAAGGDLEAGAADRGNCRQCTVLEGPTLDAITAVKMVPHRS